MKKYENVEARQFSYIYAHVEPVPAVDFGTITYMLNPSFKNANKGPVKVLMKNSKHFFYVYIISVCTKVKIRYSIKITSF